jgi:hypothetical protein
MSDTILETVTINNVKYIRADSVVAAAPKPIPGKRAVFIVDRGWVVAGDVTSEADGRIKLARVLHVRSWENIGFDGMIASPKGGKVNIKPLPNWDMPADAEISRVWVDDAWGL